MALALTAAGVLAARFESEPGALYEAAAANVVARVAAGESSTVVAAEHGIRQSTLSNITHGHSRRALAAEFFPALREPSPLFDARSAA